jgi:hypothetical protein
LQNKGRAVSEQPDQLVVADLVGDAGANSTGSGEHLVCHRRAVLGDPQERRTQAALGDELVDGVGVEKVCERRRQFGSRSEQCLPSPVLSGETLSIDPNQPLEHGVPGYQSGHSVIGVVMWVQGSSRPALFLVAPGCSAAIRSAIRSAVGTGIGSTVGTSIGSTVGTSIGPTVRATVRACFRSAVSAAVLDARYA